MGGVSEMIRIKAELKDFMDVTPVSDADVEITVQVIPRWRKIIPPDETSPHPRREIEPGFNLAENFTQSGRSTPDGTLQRSFNVTAAFRRLKELTDDSGNKPFDVVAVPRIRVAVAGLDRTVSFDADLYQEEGPNLLGEAATVERTIALDFAKASVGHTTPNSTTLWFALHGSIRPGDRYICELEQAAAPPQPRPLQTLTVSFAAAGTGHTAVVEVTGLQPTTPYTYTLRLRAAGDADQPRTGRVLARGEFITAPASADRLSLVFASCHSPTNEDSLNRWKALANRDDYDLMLLLGDQIYEDNIESLGNDWFTRYMNRYHQFWTYWPIREVLRRTPTYRIFDDHDVKDDWGTKPIDDPRERDRVLEALRAYRIFQHAYNPGGEHPTSNFFYSFRWGPAAFFVIDCRSLRSIPPDGLHPILGRTQFEALRAWARGEAREADVIFFVTSVPIAFLPIEEIRRLIDELQDAATEGGALAGFLLGGPLGAAIGAYIGHEIAEKKLSERALLI
jgi:PhoD-like phosphatase